MKGEILPLLLACATGFNLSKCQRPERFEDAAVCVVMATEGYPGSYEKGSVISGLDEAEKTNDDVVVFHAGTAEQGGKIIATGGRVLGVTARAETVTHAIDNAYKAIDAVNWPEGFCRRDIGWRAKGRS
jgi:phosphoribosylamine--glycine ligase